MRSERRKIVGWKRVSREGTRLSGVEERSEWRGIREE